MSTFCQFWEMALGEAKSANATHTVWLALHSLHMVTAWCMISRKSRGQCKQRERKHEAGTETDSRNSQFGAISEMDRGEMWELWVCVSTCPLTSWHSWPSCWLCCCCMSAWGAQSSAQGSQHSLPKKNKTKHTNVRAHTDPKHRFNEGSQLIHTTAHHSVN